MPSTPPPLQETIAFVRLLNDFRLVRRKLLLRGGDQDENDAEHSYQLAMVTWFFISRAKLPLDLGKAMRIALAHDLPEVYAGDTPVFGSDELKATKKEREAAATARLEQEWGHIFPEFIEAMRSYEAKDCEEAKLVYALDKIVVPMNILEDGGRNWRRFEVTYEMMCVEKRSKVGVHSTVADFSETLISFLAEHKHLFHKDK